MRCEHCGQPIPPKALPEGIRFSPLKERIWEAVRRHPGLSAMEMMGFVYIDVDGGPEDINGLRVAIAQMNRLLRHFGMEISGRDRRGYRVRGFSNER